MSTEQSHEYDRVKERFELIANGPALFNAVISGLEFGIFKFLSEKPKASFEDIRIETSLNANKLRPLMQALCATELIIRENGLYRNSGYAEDELVSNDRNGWLTILLGWQKIYYPAFVHMTEALREGTNQRALSIYKGNESTLYQRLAHAPDLQEIFHAAMGAFTMKSMTAIVESPEWIGVNRLIDIGGNDGTTANQLIKRYPDLKITIFDLPAVTKTIEGEKSFLNEEKIQLHPGDIFKDPFPREANAILFSHILEIFSGEQIVFLLKKAYEALPPGGKVLIYGYNVSDDEQRGLYSARLSLYLNVLASGQGMAYPKKDWEQWLREAGFKRVHTYAELPYEHGLNVGWKE